MDGLRLFVAIDPPRAAAEQLSGWARDQLPGSSGVRVMPPRSIHLTLAFLGSRPATDVDPITAAIAGVCAESAPFTITLADPLLLPRRRPNVLSIAITDDDRTLANLQSRVSDRIEEATTWQPERRTFRPHLTVARLNRSAQPPRELSPPPRGEFTASEVLLYRSHLDPAGARYEQLAAVAL